MGLLARSSGNLTPRDEMGISSPGSSASTDAEPGLELGSPDSSSSWARSYTRAGTRLSCLPLCPRCPALGSRIVHLCQLDDFVDPPSPGLAFSALAVQRATQGAVRTCQRLALCPKGSGPKVWAGTKAGIFVKGLQVILPCSQVQETLAYLLPSLGALSSWGGGSERERLGSFLGDVTQSLAGSFRFVLSTFVFCLKKHAVVCHNVCAGVPLVSSQLLGTRAQVSKPPRGL